MHRYQIPDESQKPAKREMKEPRFSRRSESGADRGEGPSEQYRWEEQQISKGVVKYGSKERKERKERKGSIAGEETEYELLMEDKIDFVLADLNPGNLGENKKEVSNLINQLTILFLPGALFTNKT